MSYNKFQDDDDKGQARSPSAYPADVNQQVQQITSSFNQLDGAFKNVEQQCMRLQKCENQSDLKQYQQNIQQQIQGLQSVNLPEIEQAILALQKKSLALQDAGQRTQLQALENKFNSLYNTKKQQISNFSASFEKIVARVTQMSGADGAEGGDNSLQNFQMQMLQEEVDEQLDQIKEIDGEMLEINNLMKTMATNVYKGGQTIELISDRVNEANEKVIHGVDNLEKAKQTQKSKNKWLFWGLGALVVVVVVVILIFVL